jgi:hypothetical protein
LFAFTSRLAHFDMSALTLNRVTLLHCMLVLIAVPAAPLSRGWQRPDVAQTASNQLRAE